MCKISTNFISKYFTSSVRKRASAVVAILYVKNYIKVLKILQCTLLGKAPQKLDVFALSIQYILILQEAGQDKRMETLD